MSRESTVAPTKDQIVPEPAVVAAIAGAAAIAAAGAALDTDCASTSSGPRCRRSRPCTGER